MAADGLARVAAASGRHEEAWQSSRSDSAMRRSPATSRWQATCSTTLGRTDEAERSYRLAEAAWRSDTPEPARLARFLADRAGRADEAVRVAEAAIAERRDIFTADALAWAYFRAGRLEDARRAHG